MPECREQLVHERIKAQRCGEGSAKVWAKVKTEKIDRAEFWAKLEVTKYLDDKERLESLALDGIDKGDGKA